MSNTDPCAVESVAQDVADHGSADERSEVELRMQRCAATRVFDQQMKLNAACTAMVRHVSAGSLDAADEAFCGERMGLVKRIATGALLPADLATEEMNLPCGKDLVPAFAQAAAKSSSAWAGFDAVSDTLTVALDGVALTANSSAALTKRLDALAKKASTDAKSSDDLAHVLALCELEPKLKLQAPVGCKLATAKSTQLHAREDAKGAAADAVEENEERRQNTAWMACSRQCNTQRSAGQAQADETRASDCTEQCGGDATCLAGCAGGRSNDTCLGRCTEKFPLAAAP